MSSGSAAGGLAIILLGLVIVIVIIYLWKRKGKHEKVQSNGSYGDVSIKDYPLTAAQNDSN